MPTRHTINQSKYDKEHRRVYGFRLHNDLDKDIINKLASVPNMQGYIKQLIRADIAESAPKTESEDKTMFTYTVKPEYIHMWGEETTGEEFLTRTQIENIARGWDKEVFEILPQLIIKDKYGNSWDHIVSFMDEDLREEVHAKLAPCGTEEFLTEYMKLHKEKYGEDFVW